jgi:hypothetical protein
MLCVQREDVRPKCRTPVTFSLSLLAISGDFPTHNDEQVHQRRHRIRNKAPP